MAEMDCQSPKSILGECLPILREMPDKSVDQVIADPPYDEQTHEGALSADAIDFAPLASMEHVREALRVARRWVVCFCALEQLGAYQAAAGDAWVRAGVWIRHSGPQKTGDRPAQAAEGIAIMHPPGKKKWNRGGGPGKWDVPLESDRVHPTQKPLALMEMLLRDFTDYGDVVLDPFMGSGTTGVAAVRLGRKFIGIERVEKHFESARKRLSAAREQLTIFSERSTSKAKQLTIGDLE